MAVTQNVNALSDFEYLPYLYMAQSLSYKRRRKSEGGFIKQQQAWREDQGIGESQHLLFTCVIRSIVSTDFGGL